MSRDRKNQVESNAQPTQAEVEEEKKRTKKEQKDRQTRGAGADRHLAILIFGSSCMNERACAALCAEAVGWAGLGWLDGHSPPRMGRWLNVCV